MKRKTITKKRSVCVLAAGFFACAALLNPFAAGSEKVLADEQVPSIYTNEMVPAAQA